jgi:hypothetical protein
MTTDRDNDKRKKELKDKVERLAETVQEIDPRNKDLEETITAVVRMIYIANIHTLKEFLVDRNCEGEKPRIIVESPYTRPGSDHPVDVMYMPHNIPEKHQVILDMLKKQELVPPDATIESYDFLFDSVRND